MRPMSSGGLQLLSQLKLKRPRTSSSSIAQRDREGKEDRGDIPRNRDRDRDILLSPRVSSRLSSANTQVIKIGVESESGDEGMVQEAQDIVEDQGNVFFLEHEQDPDNENHVTSYVHHQSLISEEFVGEPGEEGEERPRTSARPPTTSSHPPTSIRPATSRRSPPRPTTAAAASPVRDFAEREQRRGEDDRGHLIEHSCAREGHLTERSSARQGRTVTFNPSLSSMHSPGLSKKADAAVLQGLVYNAFDDIEARMHGTQMTVSVEAARQESLKRPAMTTTAANAHNSLARTRVGDERKGDKRWNSWHIDGHASILCWPAAICESRPMTGIPIDPTRMHSHLRIVGNEEKGVRGFLTKTRPTTTPPPSIASPAIMQAARKQAVKNYGLHADKAADFCYDGLASSAPANIGLSGSQRRLKNDLGGSYSAPFFRNMGYSSLDPRGGGNHSSTSFHPPRYGTLRDYSDTVISHAF